jgi:hypothetical protein
MYELLHSLRVVEDPHLPRSTMRAPLSLIREIQCTIGPCGIRLEISEDEYIHFSTDLFAIFSQWQDRDDRNASNHGEWN